MAARKSYRAPRRLYLSRDKERVVEEGDPEAGFLLAAEGAEVPQAEVDRYQLHELPEPNPAADAPKGKMVAAPPEDKAKAPPGAGAPGAAAPPARPPAAAPAERRPPPAKEPA